MLLKDCIIETYCLVDDFLKEALAGKTLRKSGPKPNLADAEVITMEVVGKYLGQNNDKAIWSYFKRHCKPLFPKMGCRTSFTRQCANLTCIKEKVQRRLPESLGRDQDLTLFDGFPIPICHIKRSKTDLRYEGKVGYCAAKDWKYFGFKEHL
jgi:hypothetical protein